jgi:hypothetical protein
MLAAVDPVRRWEYKIVLALSNDQAEQQIRALGRDGWELVGVAVNPDNYSLFLKRPVP